MQAPHAAKRWNSIYECLPVALNIKVNITLKSITFSHKAYLQTVQVLQPRCVATFAPDRKFQVNHDSENSTNTVLYTKEGLYKHAEFYSLKI